MTIIAQRRAARELDLAPCRKLIDKTSHRPVHLIVLFLQLLSLSFFLFPVAFVAALWSRSVSTSFDTDPDTDPPDPRPRPTSSALLCVALIAPMLGPMLGLHRRLASGRAKNPAL